jgi:hypothetical protein
MAQFLTTQFAKGGRTLDESVLAAVSSWNSPGHFEPDDNGGDGDAGRQRSENAELILSVASPTFTAWVLTVETQLLWP